MTMLNRVLTNLPERSPTAIDIRRKLRPFRLLYSGAVEGALPWTVDVSSSEWLAQQLAPKDERELFPVRFSGTERFRVSEWIVACHGFVWRHIAKPSLARQESSL